MPKADPIIFDVNDFASAREWLAEQSSTALGTKLVDEDGVLVNPESKAVYNVVVVRPRENNALTVVLKSDGSLFGGGKADAHWLVVVESNTSEINLIPFGQFNKLVEHTRANGGTFQGCRVEGEAWLYVHMNLGWAAQSKLIYRTVVGGKDDDSFFNWRLFKLAKKEDFVHLHNHSMYSMLDGVAPPAELVRAAVHNGQPGIALTDHGYMFGLYKFEEACREYEIKPIFGCEAYLVDDVKARYKDVRGNDRRFEYHITLHAMNQTGWENLCTLMSVAGRDHYYYVPRIDFNLLAKYNEGLICLSGCFKGPGQFHLQQYDPQVTADLPWYRYDPDRSREVYTFLKRAFGDRLYGEVHKNDYQRYMEAVPRILQMFEDVGLPPTVAQDAHYSVTEDAILQRLLTRINSNKVDEIGEGSDQTGPYYIKSRTEIDHPLFQPAFFDRTCEILERCTLRLTRDLKKDGYLFPAYDMPADRDWSSFQQQHKGKDSDGSDS